MTLRYLKHWNVTIIKRQIMYVLGQGQQLLVAVEKKFGTILRLNGVSFGWVWPLNLEWFVLNLR